MFDETAHDEDERLAGWSPAALVIGSGVVAIAVSGLIDDAGLLRHPYWVVPAACVFAACAAVAARTVRRVVVTDQ
ncbi:MAG: hypothetical protein R2710_02060 [Acidimicrobiales bacterium]